MKEHKLNLEEIGRFFRSSQNVRFISFLALITIVYLGFFTSKLWLPDYSDIKRFTQLNQVLMLDDREITIQRWEYLPSQQRMEIELNVVNKAYDGINDYAFSAITNNNKSLTTNVIANDYGFLVVELDGIPDNWKEISFRMKVNYSEENQLENAEVLKMYTNRNDVSRVECLEPKTAESYYKDRVYAMIEEYEQNISTFEDEIETLEEKIAEAKEINTNLVEKIPLQAPKDAENLKKNIENNEKQIKAWEESIVSFEQSILDMQNLIIETRNTLKNYD